MYFHALKLNSIFKLLHQQIFLSTKSSWILQYLFYLLAFHINFISLYIIVELLLLQPVY